MTTPSPVADAAAANQLQMAPTTMTAARIWSLQIVGLYTLLYPFIAVDFQHHLDALEWWAAQFLTHTHVSPSSGGPTSPPVEGLDPFDQATAESLTVDNPATGTPIRVGIPEVLTTTASFAASEASVEAQAAVDKLEG